ncbi:MAG: hypothetical protein VB859_00620, partial [Planctomycetaceae bacterium]
LVPLDVAVRRIQIDPAILIAWLRPRQAATTETMGNLLRRKQAVGSQLDARRNDPSMTPTPGSDATVAPQHLAGTEIDPASPPTTAPEATTSRAQSTTERLLAMKRRRQDTSQDTSQD